MRHVFVLLLTLAVLPRAAAADRTLVIESFDADVQVFDDGRIQITETIRPRFTGSWNGIFRSIPIEYRTPQGFNYTLLLDVESVTDDEGRALRYESSRERHYRKLRIWVPGASDSTRTVMLRYNVQNGLRFFEEHDELYWNITGDEWEVPIEAATARFRLPSGVSGLRAVAFTGGYGSREQAATVETGSNEVRVRTLRALSFREGLTAAVAWNSGVIPRPGAIARAAWFMRSNGIFAVPIVASIVMALLWHTRGRDPRLRPITTRYEPPERLTPAEVGTLVDHSPDMRDITATIVDLAVRGYVVIEEARTEQLFGLLSNTEYTFTLQKDIEQHTLRPHEHELLRAMFGRGAQAGSTVKMAALTNRFYRHLPKIREHIYSGLISQEHYVRRPDRVKKLYLILGAVAGGLVAWGGGMLNQSLGMAPESAIIAGVLTAAVICGFGLIMPVRTVRGAEALEHVLGFEEFLERVESERFERVIKTPELFEKYLPFAMALSLESNWARAFEDIYREPPQWYRGGNFQTFRSGAFVNTLGRMSTATASVMSSSPRGSGGSGFSGGRSGGGFGGGGGGGF